MKRELRYPVEDELYEAALWYEEQRTGLDVDFLEAVENTLCHIEDTPLLYPVVYRDVRRALTDRFPFGVFYRVEGDTVVVLAIVHLHRDPAVWKRRR